MVDHTLVTSPTPQAKAERKPCPEEHANFLSRLFFFWAFPLINYGYKTPLQDADLWELRSFERGANTTESLSKQWVLKNSNASSDDTVVDTTTTTDTTKKKTKNRLEASIVSTFKSALIITGILRFLDVGLALIQPVLLNRLIIFLEDKDQPVRNGYIWAFAIFLGAYGKTIVEVKYFSVAMRTGMRVRSALQGMLYNKSLILSPTARASASLGEIVNLMQLDSQRIGDSVQLIHTLWSAPLQIIISVGLLYNFIGVSSLIGFVLTFLTIPTQGGLFMKQIKLRRQTIMLTDKRVKLMNEILQGIKAVKFYAWEKPFSNLVTKQRSEEISNLRASVWVTSGLVGLLLSFPLFIGVLTFSFYAGVFKEVLNPAKVFPGIALLNQLRVPVTMLPLVFTATINARIGIKRIESLFDLEDIEPRPDAKPKRTTDTTPSVDDRDTEELSLPLSTVPPQGLILIKDGEFEWSQVDQNPLKVEKKKGPFSSCFPGKKGKGSIKSEMNGKHGSLESKSKLDESSDAGIARMKTGMKGKESLSESKINPLHSPGSDMTKMDERNSNLKPKAVVGPVLRDININLSAGKLHAVVGHVGSGKSSLFHAILGEMKKTKGDVRLEGTIAYVPQTAWIFHDTLRNNVLFGKEYDDELYRIAIEVSGLEQDVSILPNGDQTSIGEKGVNLSGGQKQRVSLARAVYMQADVYLLDDPLSALDAHVSQHVFEKCLSNSGVLSNKLRVLVTNQVHVLPDCDYVIFLDSGTVKGQGHYDDLRTSDNAFKSLVSDQEKALKEHKEDSQTSTVVEGTNEEEHKKGDADPEESMKKGTYALNVKPGSSMMQSEDRETGKVGFRVYLDYLRVLGRPIVIILVLTLFVISTALPFVTQWWLTFWARETTEEDNPRSTGFFLSIYFAISVVYAFSTFMRSTWLLTLALNAAMRIHNSMLENILRAPLTFFDTTPIGRILSRFSRDIAALDEQLPQFFHQTINTTIALVLTNAFIGFLLPPFLGAAAPVLLLYLFVMRYFKRTLLELKRLDSISKSPIYAHFSETLNGLTVIRAFGKQEAFRKANMEKVDLNQRAYFVWIITTRLFTFCLETGSCILVFATAIFGVISRNERYSGFTGLALTYSLQVTQFLGFFVRSLAELEGQMSSVERANYYIKEIPQEAPSKIDGATPEGWPGKGEIEFDSVELRYREGLPMVLGGISLKIKAGEKIGVVGRTGSGKSSMMIALLRMVEPCGGRILIDDVDLKTLGLDDIRSKITIIPQDPVLFSGTIRLNLDPFGQFSDAELWDALDKSHLKQFVSSFEEGLDAPVSEYGENLSAGQRQIICLTRALLRNSKILILDEASSSLDIETDGLIQETIRKYLKDSTILTIAHRLLTLADYDRIAVIDNGKIVQVGRPEDLLKEGGPFSTLVDSMGQSGSAHFRRRVTVQ